MNKIKGDLYEQQIFQYLLNSNKNYRVWLWKDAPEQELQNAKILTNWNEWRLIRKETHKINPLQDLGCDILLKIDDNTYILIQCKNYSDTNSIRMEDLAGCFQMSLIFDLQAVVYYTSKLSRNIFTHHHEKIKYIKMPFEEEIPQAVMDQEVVRYTNLMNTPFPYQIEAYEQLKDKHRTILQLPCGMGKTLISMMIAQSYNHIIIVSPLKEYCKQNLERYRNEQSFASHACLLIDSDGTRCVSEIRDFIQQNEKYIISVTYKSIDVINEIMDDIDCSQLIGIVDELHNLSQKDVVGAVVSDCEEEYEDISECEEEEIIESPMHTFLTNMDIKILFMSATPRIFEMDAGTDEMDSEIFGKVDYSYSMADAIKNGFICDYQLFVPNVSLNNETTITEVKNEITTTVLENGELISKATFIMRGCLETGSKKCIVYHRTQQEAEEFMNCLLAVNDFYSVNLYATTILSKDSATSRRKKLDHFIQFEGYTFLCSVEILNECIDIPNCDSIYITYPSESKIRNIQRVNRATRKNVKNPHKVANIFLWAEEYDNITKIISHLKEYDDSFTIQKIKLLNNTNETVIEIQEKDVEKQKLNDVVIGVKKIKSWEERYEELQLFLEINDEYPSHHSEQPNEKSLGQFVKDQRKQYKKGKLCTERIQKLEELKVWTWDVNDDNWLEKYNLLRIFLQTTNGNYPNCKSTHATEKSLGHFVVVQKTNYKKETLNAERIQKLEELKDWIWDLKEENWLEQYNKLKTFIQTNGKYPSGTSQQSSNEKSLGRFVEHQRKQYKKGKLCTERIQKLEELNNWKWFIDKEGNWMEKYNVLQAFMKINDKYPSHHSKQPNEKKLGKFIENQRKNYKEEMISPERIHKLEELNNWKWDVLEDNWLEKYNELQSFIETKDQYPNSKSTQPNEKKIGTFVQTQRAYYKKRKISAERIQKLQELQDWKWTVK